MVGGLEELVEASPQSVEMKGSVLTDILKALEALREPVELPEKNEIDLEALSPVVEQDIDPDSYEHSEYEIKVYDEKAAYTYTTVEAKDNEVEYVAQSQSQEETVVQVQEAIEESKSAEHFHQVNMARFDERAQASIQELKVEYGQFITFLMYSGEVRF